MDCQRVAAYRIDVVKSHGPDHSFACKEHLGEILDGVLKVCRGNAARVSMVPLSNEEPCELGVE
jgi:hypothetical protein